MLPQIMLILLVVPPVNPPDLEHARWLLMTNEEPYEPDVHRLHNYLRVASVNLGLLEEQNAPIYFRHDGENLIDLRTMRARREQTEANGNHWARFGLSLAAAREYQQCLYTIRARLQDERLLWRDRDGLFDQEIMRLDWFINLWGSVGHNNSWSVTRVRDMLTEEEWAAGKLPRYKEQRR